MGALDNVTILDLSRVLAGPYCTQMLADLGATIWKVESPWGDDTRRFGPPFVQDEAVYFLSTNRGKKSLVINLRDPRGQELVRRLAERADVFVENFKVGDLARYGLDYAALATLNPRLVYASITGFGQTGPRAQEPGYDAALQGMTGIMSVTGYPAGPPTKVGVAWVDLMTGLVAAIGILAALRERERSGHGQQLDLSLFDTGVMAMLNLAQNYLSTGDVPGRIGNAHQSIVPYETFAASDGWFVLGVGNDEQYRKAMLVLGRPDLANDPQFQHNGGRVAKRRELIATIAAVVKNRPRAIWVRELNAAGVPASPVNDLAEVFSDPQTAARESVWQVQHPTLGPLSLLANALQHMSRTPAVPSGHPPLLGEHTEEVLSAELDLDRAALDALLRDGVIAVAKR